VVKSVTVLGKCYTISDGDMQDNPKISQVNMLMQHYLASTNLGRKLDASLRFQL
jgi:hypothetical protein